MRYEKLSVLATVERTGCSQVLITGVSMSDKHKYVNVNLGLFKTVYPDIAGQEKLLVFSDEDRAFILSTREILPKASKFDISIEILQKDEGAQRPRVKTLSKKLKIDLIYLPLTPFFVYLLEGDSISPSCHY
jgi:hypothetical protein